jgi:hypothetical protein
MPAPQPTTLLSFIGRLVGARLGVTAARCTTLVGYSSFMLLVAIAAIAVLTQVRAGTKAPHGITVDVSS